MYSTCVYCQRPLGANHSIENFPVGKRLAFDAAKGRLWVVCLHCTQWNLSPIEERWEAVEECERAFRSALTRVSTGNIGLARLRSGLDLVRIGKPLRSEFAAWRYGQRLGKRRKRAAFVAGAGAGAAALTGIAITPAIAPALAMGTISILALPGLSTILGVVPTVAVLAARDYIQHERVVGLLGAGRRLITVRAKHVESA